MTEEEHKQITSTTDDVEGMLKFNLTPQDVKNRINNFTSYINGTYSNEESQEQCNEIINDFVNLCDNIQQKVIQDIEISIILDKLFIEAKNLGMLKSKMESFLPLSTDQKKYYKKVIKYGKNNAAVIRAKAERQSINKTAAATRQRERENARQAPLLRAQNALLQQQLQARNQELATANTHLTRYESQIQQLQGMFLFILIYIDWFCNVFVNP